jgi:hypothetical protein
MVERNDPARAGVKAGRVVGVATAALSVAALLGVQDTYYEQMTVLLGFVGADAVPLAAVFWGNVALTAAARYTLAYVVGSLVGVVYDWLGRPSLVVLGILVSVVGAVDGAFAALDTRSAVFGVAYLLAWLCYVPVFARVFDESADERSGPARLS